MMNFQLSKEGGFWRGIIFGISTLSLRLYFLVLNSFCEVFKRSRKKCIDDLTSDLRYF